MARVPDYVRVVNDIAGLIEVGELKGGDRLPTYAELAKRYEVSVTTVQTALRILSERGLVEGQQGKGVFVRDQTQQ
ncbi:winged helix-turn-helix domain-containing protein [Micromonospora olivasterospora]|uniref:Regulatory GntR family protein n=1 Tax=Micromonospora olivasterospora TaxID=1880 RepID=A0A562IA08_MICOL|nr:winged helix-turn-helix domain-containing protein [Micromonospora olivasterospora]TWH67686.1 regulatory GntR family protein [Micromonospora olivasterospora]